MNALSLSYLVPNLPISANILLILVAGFSIAWYIQYIAWNRRLQGLSLPPGPKGLPLLGNLMDIPNVKHPWVAYRDWASIYGKLSPPTIRFLL